MEAGPAQGSTVLARDFRAELNNYYAALLTISPSQADAPWREHGWTRKQILGHLLDSAANNRQRFVRAAIDGQYSGPNYAQDAWLAAHGYEYESWETLLRWWRTEHEILAAVVDRIPDDRLDAKCRVGDGPVITLRSLVEDYLAHHRQHFQQLIAL
jgi:hypothetical protein